jgi:hypothetical protein
MQQIDLRNSPSAESTFVGKQGHSFKKIMVVHRWSTDTIQPRASDFDSQGWGPALRAIEQLQPLNPSLGWKFARYVHYDNQDKTPIKEQTYDYGRKRVTGASINIAVDKASGIVLYQPGTPPKVAASRLWLGVDIVLPDIRHPSDFMWAHWRAQSPTQPEGHRNVQYCGVQEVSDCATIKLIARFFLMRSIYDLEDFPADNSIWTTDTPEGRALIGKYISVVE